MQSQNNFLVLFHHLLLTQSGSSGVLVYRQSCIVAPKIQSTCYRRRAHSVFCKKIYPVKISRFPKKMPPIDTFFQAKLKANVCKPTKSIAYIFLEAV